MDKKEFFQTVVIENYKDALNIIGSNIPRPRHQTLPCSYSFSCSDTSVATRTHQIPMPHIPVFH